MKRFGCVFALVCGLSLTPALADTIIGPDVTLAVTNSEALGTDPVQLKAGTTLVFPGTDAGVAGLNEYTRTNTYSVGTPYRDPYGDFTRIIDSAYWATNHITAATNTEYIYTGRWYVPVAGLYSFYEHIDDHAALGIDGQVIFRNTVYNQPTCVQNIPLEAGWHGVEIRVFNANAGGGAAAGLLSGILFSPSNDLISVSNQTNAFAFGDPGDGSVLRTAHNGHLGQKLLVEGTATLNLADHDMALPFRLTGGLLQLTNTAGAARLVVDGADDLVFGATGLDIDYPPFNLDVAFSNAAPDACLTFRDLVTLYAWPTSCTWRVADNATLALAGTNLLGTGDIALTNHNVTMLTREAVTPGAAIRVQGTNLTVAIKPCWLDVLGKWNGIGAVFTNNIALEGIASTALFPLNQNFTLQGAITGIGTVRKTGNSRLEILAPCDFAGDVICGGGNVVVFHHITAGDSNNTVTVQNNTTLGLYPAGYPTEPTTAFVKTLIGAGTGNTLYIPAFQAMEVERIEGSITVNGDGTLRVGTLAAGATLNAAYQLAVTVDAVEPGAAIRLNNTVSLAFGGSGAVLDSLYLNDGAFTVSGAATITRVSGPGALVKQGTGTMNVLFCSAGGGIRVEAGKLTVAAPDPAGVLGSRPALWLDAAAPGVFTQYLSYVFTNNFQVIQRWNDCRPGAPYYGINTRGENNFQVYPYVMTNNQNGRPVVSMGSYQTNLSAEYGSRLEARRLPLSTNLNPQYVVMMFGSQNGGGAAAVGGDGALQRSGSTAADFRNPATPILSSAAYPVWTNGVAVTATNTGFSGGYQILTLNTQGKTVNALGWRTDYQTAGGQNYGEVLVYTNALTDLERMTAEAYLAEKWALPYANARVPSATVAAGAELEIGRSFTVSKLYGEGTVTVADGSDFTPAGLFRGTLQLSGGTLRVADQPAPPGPEAVPAASRSAWFDPSQTNRVVLGAAYTPTRPLAVVGLLDRASDGLYLLGTCGGVATNNVDRRPWLAAAAGPWGDTLHWLDYQNLYDESRGNTLRMMRDLSKLGSEYTQNTVTNVRTGFIVLDSSRGGGVPITFNVYADQVIRRDGQSYAAPIWGSGTTNIVRDAPTWLDGQPVNGASNGFSAAEEVLSFAAAGVFQAGYFGFFNGDNTATPNRERLGEIILFESALDDTTRTGIEAYLMKKWLGKARDGYMDVSGARVDGTGTVTATTPDRLPAFAETFSGSVTLTADILAFTVGTNVLGQITVTPPVTIPGALSVAASGTLTVHFAVKPPPGAYPLITCGSVTGAGFAGWSLATDGELPAGTVALKTSSTGAALTVVSPGTLFLLQ